MDTLPADRWEAFAHRLGIKRPAIISICNYVNLGNILVIWLRRRDATLYKVFEALDSIGETRAHKTLTEYLSRKEVFDYYMSIEETDDPKVINSCSLYGNKCSIFYI